jgi:hypothetical protein
MACIQYLHDGLQNAFLLAQTQPLFMLRPYLLAILTKEIKKKRKVFGGRKNNRAYHQTPIAGETTTVLLEGWLLLISGVSNLP